MEKLQHMKFLVIWFPPVAFYCFSEKSKCSLQHSVLEYTTCISSIWVRDQSLQPRGGESKIIVLCILIRTILYKAQWYTRTGSGVNYSKLSTNLISPWTKFWLVIAEFNFATPWAIY